jgi:hypothetical protein
MRGQVGSGPQVRMLRMLLHDCKMREERREDWLLVRRVNEAAFGRVDEADLVERLRAENVVLASLVAEVDSEIIGHILFSRMWIESDEDKIAAVALAPMAVMPAHQRHGTRDLDFPAKARNRYSIPFGVTRTWCSNCSPRHWPKCEEKSDIQQRSDFERELRLSACNSGLTESDSALSRLSP